LASGVSGTSDAARFIGDAAPARGTYADAEIRCLAAGAVLVGPDPVNPPEAVNAPNDGGFGPVAGAKHTDTVLEPEGGIEAMDRATLKAWMIERGLIKSTDRRGLPMLLIDAKAYQASARGEPLTVTVTDNTPALTSGERRSTEIAKAIAAEIDRECEVRGYAFDCQGPTMVLLRAIVSHLLDVIPS
jgi:hypothetical protein